MASLDASRPPRGDYSSRVIDDSEAGGPTDRPLKVVVYSDDRSVRREVMLALGRRPAADLVVEYHEVATQPALLSAADAGGVDLFILDGEAVPAGGLGMARQLKDEIYRCPPILVLIARPQDAWLATWSRADGVSAHPINAMALAQTAAGLLRKRLALSAQ
jgi:DNA-binding response OmpR family regulator